MDKKALEKLIAEYQKRADAAEQNYQETGVTRYHTTYWKNQEMVDALRMALSAKDDHETLCDIRMVLSNLAFKGAAAMDRLRPQTERVELAMKLAAEITDYGKLNGLI